MRNRNIAESRCDKIATLPPAYMIDKVD